MRRWVEERITDVLVWDVETTEKVLRVGADIVHRVVHRLWWGT